MGKATSLPLGVPLGQAPDKLENIRLRYKRINKDKRSGLFDRNISDDQKSFTKSLQALLQRFMVLMEKHHT
jgi:hypothetical protein